MGGLGFFVDNRLGTPYNGTGAQMNRFPLFDFGRTRDLLIGVVIGFTLTILLKTILGV